MEQFYKAFLAAQQKMDNVKERGTNPHFKSKYAELSDVIDSVKEPLNGNGIVFYQSEGRDELGDYVETILAHESGDKISSKVYLHISKNDMQGLGSAITYARRYGLLSICGLATDDDDGNESVKKQDQKKPQYREEDFETNFEAWADSIKAGKTTSERIISHIETRYTLSEEHKAKIRNIR